MQHTINPDGTRNREFRPYIYAEETTYNTSLYDPFRSVNYGLYRYGVEPGAIPAQQDVISYMAKLGTTAPFGSPNHTGSLYRREQSGIRDVYTPHKSGSTTTMYKQMYAI